MESFVNAQLMHIQHPNTFQVPSQEDLENIRIGSSVKICHNNERFWTEITNIQNEVLFGKVDNDLICDQPFECGDIIQFTKDHVFSIL